MRSRHSQAASRRRTGVLGPPPRRQTAGTGTAPPASHDGQPAGSHHPGRRPEPPATARQTAGAGTSSGPCPGSLIGCSRAVHPAQRRRSTVRVVAPSHPIRRRCRPWPLPRPRRRPSPALHGSTRSQAPGAVRPMARGNHRCRGRCAARRLPGRSAGGAGRTLTKGAGARINRAKRTARRGRSTPRGATLHGPVGRRAALGRRGGVRNGAGTGIGQAGR